MTVEFDASQLDDLANDLAAAAPKAVALSSATLTTISAKLRDDAKADVAVLTGDTKASIHVQGGQGWRIVVADDPAAFHLEFGTSDTAPQPFMWPQVPAAGAAMTAAFEALNPLD